MNTKAGIQGDPRKLLHRIIEANPNASETKLFEEFYQELLLEGYRDCLQTVAEYWFKKNLRSVTEGPEERSVKRAEKKRALQDKREAMSKTIEAMMDRHVKERAQSMLLDMIQPTGKDDGV